MRVPKFLYRKWDGRGHIPLWARIVWRRLHFCNEFDGLLTGDERPGDAFLCACVRWPKRFYVEQAKKENKITGVDPF